MSSTRTDFATYFDAITVPSLGRSIATFIVSFLAGLGIAWLADLAGAALMMGAFYLTGSVFVVTAIYLLTWAVAMAMAIYAGAAAGRYVLDRHIDRDWASLKDGASHLWDKATSMFSSKPAVTLH